MLALLDPPLLGRKRRRVETLRHLSQLEKPVRVSQLECLDEFPDDASSFLRALGYLKANETHESRAESHVAPNTGQVDKRGLKGSSRDAETQTGGEATAQATTMQGITNNLHQALIKIVGRANRALHWDDAESQWNMDVHAPLLNIVFADEAGLTVPMVFERVSNLPTEKTVACWVLVNQANILSDYVPWMGPGVLRAQGRSLSPLDGPPDPGSASEAHIVRGSTTTNGTGNTKGGGKRIDFALVLDIRNSPLQWPIAEVFQTECDDRDVDMHVNQTLAKRLRYAPIACSIETKTAYPKENPLWQLGVWTCAWHKRMNMVRGRVNGAQARLLPTVLLLSIVSHDWRLYFAIDEGHSVKLVDSLRIGSTKSLSDAYALIRSLEAIKAWMEGPFHDSLMRWFGCQGRELDDSVLLKPSSVKWSY